MKKLSILAFLILMAVVFSSCLTDSEDEEWSAAKVCPESKRGTFTDERDGRVYKYTTIGKQVWMAENLNYKVEYATCFYEDTGCEGVGLRYYSGTAEGACPVGWHLPSMEEWEILYESVGGKKVAAKRLKSSDAWLKLNADDNTTGTDDCGFSILPYRVSRKQDGLETEFITSTIEYGDHILTATFLLNEDNASISTDLTPYKIAYVRCLKD